MNRKTESIGRQGEYLVAAFLSKYTTTVNVVPHGAEEDIVFKLNDRYYGCQVKTKSKKEKIIKERNTEKQERRKESRRTPKGQHRETVRDRQRAAVKEKHERPRPSARESASTMTIKPKPNGSQTPRHAMPTAAS